MLDSLKARAAGGNDVFGEDRVREADVPSFAEEAPEPVAGD